LFELGIPSSAKALFIDVPYYLLGIYVTNCYIHILVELKAFPLASHCSHLSCEPNKDGCSCEV